MDGVRWNFRGSATASHGTHEYQRHGGAIGTNMTPGRTLPNLKMGGQYGNETVSVLNLKVARVELAVCPDVAFSLLNKKRVALADLEQKYKKRVLIRSDQTLGLDQVAT